MVGKGNHCLRTDDEYRSLITSQWVSFSAIIILRTIFAPLNLSGYFTTAGLTLNACESYLIHMKQATVRDLRTKFPHIERWLKEGETVTITKRAKVIAVLSAPPARLTPDFARRFGGPRKNIVPLKKGAVDVLVEERGE